MHSLTKPFSDRLASEFANEPSHSSLGFGSGARVPPSHPGRGCLGFSDLEADCGVSLPASPSGRWQLDQLLSVSEIFRDYSEPTIKTCYLLVKSCYSVLVWYYQVMNKSRTTVPDRIREIVEHIVPFDPREQADVVDVLDWIDDGSELFRRQSPDVPYKHLVSYLAVVDNARRSMLMMDHVKAGLWVPPGGHVWPDEDPFDAAERELVEELGVKAARVSTIANLPLFVTVTQTRGPGTHTDVSLWYVVAADERMWLDVDRGEFNGHKWLRFDDVFEMDQDATDPELPRFLRKLQARL